MRHGHRLGQIQRGGLVVLLEQRYQFFAVLEKAVDVRRLKPLLWKIGQQIVVDAFQMGRRALHQKSLQLGRYFLPYQFFVFAFEPKIFLENGLVFFKIDVVGKAQRFLDFVPPIFWFQEKIGQVPLFVVGQKRPFVTTVFRDLPACTV
jgi:hypothetical protein